MITYGAPAPNWTNGLPGTFTKTIFHNFPSGSVNIGGVTRTIDTLEFDNSIGFAGNPNYTLSSGTLTLKNLTVTGYLAPEIVSRPTSRRPRN